MAKYKNIKWARRLESGTRQKLWGEILQIITVQIGHYRVKLRKKKANVESTIERVKQKIREINTEFTDVIERSLQIIEEEQKRPYGGNILVLDWIKIKINEARNSS